MPNLLFHLQFPAPALPAQIVVDSHFESIDGWDVSVGSPGSVVLDADKVWLSTGGGAGAWAGIVERMAYPRAPLTWSKPRQFKLKARLDVFSDTGSMIYICTGNRGTNRRAFGFRFFNTVIRGFSKNGGAESYVSLVTGITAPYTRDEVYEAVFTPGSKIDFFIDGVLKGTLTTSLPTGTEDAEYFGNLFVYSSVAVNHEIRSSMFRIIQDE
jgi:hypothetical protein